MRLQEKASQVGFDWENGDQVWDKVKEEMGEVEEAQAYLPKAGREGQGTEGEAQGRSREKLEEELGDLMFSIVNFARFNKIDADNALTLANKKFMQRFRYMEKIIGEKGQQVTDLNLKQLDELWNIAKIKLSAD
jgi:XTP/dITP diphosphohydrolase